MGDDLEQLTYRGLAERLGISADAARMKAKRKAKAGAWRIIPGNHPSAPVLVAVPAAELNGPERVGGEQERRSRGERNPRTHAPEQVNAVAEQALASLIDAQTRIRERLTSLSRRKTRTGRTRPSWQPRKCGS